MAEPESSSRANPMLDAALTYARRGWHVFPLHSRRADGRCSCQKNCGKKAAKHPRTKNGFKDATTDEAQIRSWWRQWPDANIGIATGSVSNLVVFDVDYERNGKATLEKLEAAHGKLPPTLIVSTGNGHHIYLEYPQQKISSGVGRDDLSGLDVRGDGGYVVAALSVHRNGKIYTVKPSTAQLPPAPMPSWLVALFCAKDKGRTKKSPIKISDTVPDGTRNDSLFRVGCGFRSKGMNPNEIYAGLMSLNTQGRTVPPLRDAEVRIIAERASQYPPMGENLTDVGNARRLVARYGTDLQFVPQWGRWLVWDGIRWKKDETGEILRLAKETARGIYEEASKTEDDEVRKKLAGHAKHSESGRSINAMVSLAQSEPGIPVTPEQLDTDPWLLNVTNGTIDLRTGELRPHCREDLITKLAGTTYDAAGSCPLWMDFLNRIFEGNQHLIDFLRRAVGYSLTGLTKEQVLFLLHGTGANGKSTLLNVFLALLGDYGTQVASDVLLQRRRDEHPTAIADLHGARLASAVEVEEGRRLAENLIKQLTGGDPIKARKMRQDYFEFKPQFKLFIAVNRKPIIRGTDNAIWRRIRLIPFEVAIPEHEQDKDLAHKLRAELPGILRWAVEGCMLWRRNGLGAPSEVRAATDEYRADMDTIADFINSECVQGDRCTVSKKDLYAAYKKWAEEAGESWLSKKAFGMRLTEREFKDNRTECERFWLEIGLAAQTDS